MVKIKWNECARKVVTSLEGTLAVLHWTDWGKPWIFVRKTLLPEANRSVCRKCHWKRLW